MILKPLFYHAQEGLQECFTPGQPGLHGSEMGKPDPRRHAGADTLLQQRRVRTAGPRITDQRIAGEGVGLGNLDERGATTGWRL